MAKPRKEGSGWSVRRRVKGHDIYISGYATSAAAKSAMDDRVSALESGGKPKGLGARHTTVAQAMQDCGRERLIFMKGAPQEANRINRFLRSADLATLKVSRCKARSSNEAGPQDKLATSGKGKGQLFTVTLVPPVAMRAIPRGLGKHRGALAASTAESDRIRGRLARMTVADVAPHHVQELMDAYRTEGREASTLQLERALIRSLFNHCKKSWNWAAPAANPAVDLKMPVVDNGRDRVMSSEEQERLDRAIQDCRNSLVGPTLTLLTETAMRSSEPLAEAVWRDVDWSAKILKLRDSKNDKRDVPLSPRAIEALQQLRTLGGGGLDDPIVQITYESLKAAWYRACERAGVDGLHMHDLRHTAATRMALKTGNIFLVKALTGHKTLSQLERYVNVKASDVVNVMHAETSAGTPPAAPLKVVEPVVGRSAASATGSATDLSFPQEWALD